MTNFSDKKCECYTGGALAVISMLCVVVYWAVFTHEKNSHRGVEPSPPTGTPVVEPPAQYNETGSQESKVSGAVAEIDIAVS